MTVLLGVGCLGVDGGSVDNACLVLDNPVEVDRCVDLGKPLAVYVRCLNSCSMTCMNIHIYAPASVPSILSREQNREPGISTSVISETYTVPHVQGRLCSASR